MLCHLFDGTHHRLLLLCLGIEKLELLQCESRKIGGGPGPKILCGNLLTADLSQVIVDVRGIDRMPPAFIVDVLKQLVAGEVPAIFDDASQPPVVNIGFVPDVSLPSKAQMNAGAVDLDMPVAQCRQAIALVCPGVFAVTDPEERDLHQPDDGGEYPLAR